MSPAAHEKVRKAGGIADAVLKIVGAASMVAGFIAFLLFNSWTQEEARDWLGIAAIQAHLEKQDRRMDDLEARLPGPNIALYDPVYSEIIGPCHIGETCVARFRVRRTTYGSECDIPKVTPYVRNHGAVRHPAELVGGVVRASADNWDIIEIRFRAPASAQPGRAVYWSEQDYDCPNGSFDEPSDLIPFILLARKE